MGNTISRDEHIHEIDELKKEQRKEQEEAERRHKDEINALKIQMLQNQISEYKKQMKEEINNDIITDNYAQGEIIDEKEMNTVVSMVKLCNDTFVCLNRDNSINFYKVE